jgi:hypothetical protein
MMLLDLVCAECLSSASTRFSTGEQANITIPFEPVNDSGIYEITCSKGHISKTYIDNLDFEILFDYSLNAIVDGYYREAVSSFTSSMERYFEFFLKVLLNDSGTNFKDLDNIWKTISNQSERQLGAYIIMYTEKFLDQPILLNSNKEIPFRNNVIHKGYIPTKQEAIEFGQTTLLIIETSLLKLKNAYPKTTNDTFEYYSYKRLGQIKLQEERAKGVGQDYACVNIMTTIDVKNGREININDGRKGNIEEQLKRILNHRQPRTISLLGGLC